MKSIITDLSEVEADDYIISIQILPEKKWKRVLLDYQGNEFNIYKLKVERSLNSGKIWILALYNRIDDSPNHIFYLNLDKTKVRVIKNN